MSDVYIGGTIETKVEVTADDIVVLLQIGVCRSSQ